MAERLLELGQGLSIYRFHVDELVEQDVNARTMKKEAFDRLTQTVGKDQRLEQLPFIAQVGERFEIVGGHHRVRSARTAGVTEVFGIVDETDLSRDEIRAKQLAHNAIQGYDDPQLISQIYEAIGDADARLEAFIDPKQVNITIPRIKIDDVDLGMRFETVIVMFIPWEKQYVKDAVAVVEQEINGTNAKEAWLADLDFFKTFKKVGQTVTRDYDIHTMSTALTKICELAMAQLGNPPDIEPEARIPVRDIAGTFYIPQDAAKVMNDAIDAMIEAGDVSEAARWRAFELLAADYLAGKVGLEKEPSASGS